MSQAPEIANLNPDQLLAIIRLQTDIVRLGLDLEGVMALVTKETGALTNAEGAVIELAEGSDMVYRSASGIAEGHLGFHHPKSSSLSGLCVLQNKALISHDTQTDPRVDQEHCQSLGLRSMVVVPLVHNALAVGSLKVVSARPAAFNQSHVNLLQLISDLIAAAMFHATEYATDELFYRATHDSLTGLANRSLFYDRLRHLAFQAKRSPTRFAVLMIDMDGLKEINDTYGHGAGDAALKELASRLASSFRQADTVARLGGDEFGVLLSSIFDQASTRLATARIATLTEQPFVFEQAQLKIRISTGLAFYPEDSTDPANLVAAADHAMYLDKRERRLPVVLEP